MNSLVNFFFIIVTAAIVENVVFARALATSHLMDRTRDFRNVLLLGGLMAIISGLSAIFIWLIKGLAIFDNLRAYYLPLIYLACISVVYVLVCLALKKWRPEGFVALGSLLSGVAYSGAVFGIQIIASNEHFGFADTFAYAIGGALGVTIALLMIISARERLNFSAVPRSFAGLPILLIYIGILSLAIYGLIGHQLAA